MEISVQFEAQLREVAGCGNVQLDLPEGTNLLAAIRQTSTTGREELAARLLTTDGQVQPGILTFVNDRPVVSTAADSHVLTNRDIILLLPPISGG